MFSLAEYLLAIQAQNARQIDPMQLAMPLQYHQLIGQANIAPLNGLMNPLLPVNNIPGQGLGFMGMGMGVGVGMLALQAQQAQQVQQTLQAAELTRQQQSANMLGPRPRKKLLNTSVCSRKQQSANMLGPRKKLLNTKVLQTLAEHARLLQEAAELNKQYAQEQEAVLRDQVHEADLQRASADELPELQNLETVDVRPHVPDDTPLHEEEVFNEVIELSDTEEQVTNMEAVKEFASNTTLKIKRGPLSLSLNKSSSNAFGRALRVGKALQTIGSDAEEVIMPVTIAPQPKKKKSLQEVKECMKTNFGASTLSTSKGTSPKKSGKMPSSSTPKTSRNVAGKHDPQLASPPPSKKDKRVLLTSDEDEEFVDNDGLVENFRPFLEQEKKLEAIKLLPRKRVKKDLVWELYDDLEKKNVQLKNEVKKLKARLKKRNGGKVVSEEDESD